MRSASGATARHARPRAESRKAEMRNGKSRLFPAAASCESASGAIRSTSNVYRILCDTEYLYYCMDYAQTRIEKVAIELRGLTSKANNAANYLSSCAHACACPTLTVTLPPSIPSLHKRTLCTTQSEQPFMRFCEKVSSERLSRSRTTITRYAKFHIKF